MATSQQTHSDCLNLSTHPTSQIHGQIVTGKTTSGFRLYESHFKGFYNLNYLQNSRTQSHNHWIELTHSFIFKTGSPYLAQASLELTFIWPFCFSLLLARIIVKGPHTHHQQPLSQFAFSACPCSYTTVGIRSWACHFRELPALTRMADTIFVVGPPPTNSSYWRLGSRQEAALPQNTLTPCHQKHIAHGYWCLHLSFLFLIYYSGCNWVPH